MTISDKPKPQSEYDAHQKTIDNYTALIGRYADLNQKHDNIYHSHLKLIRWIVGNFTEEEKGLMYSMLKQQHK